jgi:predicted house-cleaning noncanonical NTP pyrophosphatase (MazG superfamily)
MIKKYYKLVRDNVPLIIMDAGKRCNYKNLDTDKALFHIELVAKLDEEVAEYVAAYNPDELIDILEVVYALAKTHKISENELNKAREDKKKKRGGFDEAIYLMEVEEDE